LKTAEPLIIISSEIYNIGCEQTRSRMRLRPRAAARGLGGGRGRERAADYVGCGRGQGRPPTRLWSRPRARPRSRQRPRSASGYSPLTHARAYGIAHMLTGTPGWVLQVAAVRGLSRNAIGFTPDGVSSLDGQLSSASVGKWRRILSWRFSCCPGRRQSKPRFVFIQM
jgi:hypothetical protein